MQHLTARYVEEHGGRKPGLRDQLRLAKQAADACSVIACLAIAAHRGDGDYSQLAYAAYWKMSDRTAQRDWRLFKQAFPGEASPERFARALVADYVGRLDRLNAGSAHGLPAELAAA